MEPQEIGCLLPDDEDELLAGIRDFIEGLPLESGEKFEDFDVFSSSGGLELENDAHDLLLQPAAAASGAAHSSNAGEHPFGEHPSRTLFVRNINSNVEDSELRALFEKYGDIRTLYTTCKHRGFVMISYYDIRAARLAMRSLQGKPLRRRKLDIHFSIPKDNPSDKDINQGTLVVFNLDASVSNDSLRQIFGSYGEIKEIRETPHKRHHKFIEFYDVRAADAALRALNRTDIAGKRIKLEPSRPGGARKSLMQQHSRDVESEESFHSRIAWSNSSPGLSASLAGLSGTADELFSGSPVRIEAILNQHAIGQQHHAHSVPEYGCLSRAFSALSTSSFTNHIEGFDLVREANVDSPVPQRNRGLQRSSSAASPLLWGTPFSHVSEGFKGSGNRWQNSSPSHSYGDSSFFSSSFGSFPREAPTGSRQSYLGESPELVSQFPFGSFGRPPLPNIKTGSADCVFSPPSLGMLFQQRSFAQSLEDRRSRRSEHGSSPQAENKQQYQLDLDRIVSGEDTRTTLMIKNIPNKYTAKMLLAAIDECHHGTYDFVYLPIDFKNKCNVGYAFINLLSPSLVVPFYQTFNGKKWEKFNSEKVASLAYARIQGKAALIAHFQNSSLMNEDKRCRPIIFHGNGHSAASEQETSRFGRQGNPPDEKLVLDNATTGL